MHITVLYHEVIEWIQPRAGGRYIDATLGYGGHTSGLLQMSAPTGLVLAFDRDADAIAAAKERLGTDHERVTFAHNSFAAIEHVAQEKTFTQVDGIVFDLGLSSMQLDSRNRGFSFRYEAPLDMRFDQSKGQTAAEIINNLDEAELRDIFYRYGEENHGRKLARIVVENRPIHTTTQLADLIAQHSRRGRSRTHPATRIFQALRIAVNDELGALETGLTAALELLKPGGRIAVISFHSLEDRFVKRLFRDLSRDCVCPPRQPVCTCDTKPTLSLPQRKAIKPSDTEIADNPRSRSARLRIATKL